MIQRKPQSGKKIETLGSSWSRRAPGGEEFADKTSKSGRKRGKNLYRFVVEGGKGYIGDGEVYRESLRTSKAVEICLIANSSSGRPSFVNKGPVLKSGVLPTWCQRDALRHISKERGLKTRSGQTGTEDETLLCPTGREYPLLSPKFGEMGRVTWKRVSR